MEISSEKRFILCKGLDCLIGMKEFEINEIKTRTEQDYSIARSFEKYMDNGFSLEVAKERDIQKVIQEIKELRRLREEINSLKNHLLLIPQFVKLQLNTN
ncbi:hypothetical protein ACIQD3_22605 [Peribacillus loiseleuriae]|uniref:hypothetical protein n=1 Tax=Peribacillus loiseleuriae TaxID=1679170 RepID=UPI0037FA7ADA